MSGLDDCVREYQNSDDLPSRLQCADAIIQKVGPSLWAFISKRCPPEDAKDAYQSTLIAIAAGLAKVKARSEQQFWCWCYTIAWYKCADVLRERMAARVEFMDMASLERVVDASNSSNPISPGERLDLEEAMELLSSAKPPCYDYLWLRFFQDLDYASIGKIFGRSADAARQRTERCLKSLRKRFGGKD